MALTLVKNISLFFRIKITSYGNYLEAPIELKVSTRKNDDPEIESWELINFKKFGDEFEKRLKQTGLTLKEISFLVIATSNYLKIF